jgi:hypothetical protein
MATRREAERPASFVHLAAFVKDCARLKFTLDDLRELELEILEDPTIHPVITGTGGVRKCRFGPPSWRTGKSGGVRVAYADLPEHGLIVLVTMFAKSERGNLSRDERNQLRVAMERIKRALADKTF